MQTILPPSGNTIKILGKARSAEHGLRWMTYVLAQPVEGGVLVFHTLTRALLLLTPEEYAAPDNLPELRDGWFRVPQEMDGEQVMVEADGGFAGMVRSNATAAFIIDQLKTETTKEAILDAMCKKYDAPRAVMAEDVDMVLGNLKKIGALDSNHPILLLDEATSALDEATALRLLNNLRKMTDKTVILVTHRMNQAGFFDAELAFSKDGICVRERKTCK